MGRGEERRTLIYDNIMLLPPGRHFEKRACQSKESQGDGWEMAQRETQMTRKAVTFGAPFLARTSTYRYIDKSLMRKQRRSVSKTVKRRKCSVKWAFRKKTVQSASEKKTPVWHLAWRHLQIRHNRRQRKIENSATRFRGKWVSEETDAIISFFRNIHQRNPLPFKKWIDFFLVRH